jgi:geranylgeranyl diphosphate synthase, type II
MKQSSEILNRADEIDLAAIRQSIENQLALEMATPSHAPERLRDAMSHALLAPSKRVRPLVLYLMTEPTGPLIEPALMVGMAIEMVHTSSLVLDDLPSMDDAKMRRQRPTTHVAFGEATAILGAISLLTRAFSIIARLDDVPPQLRTRLVSVLSEAVGWNGLSAGQELDIHGNGSPSEHHHIENLNWLKTGVLFEATAEMGAILGGRNEAQISASRRFAKHFGLAYQTLDDLLDNSGSSTELGKDVNKDEGKSNLVRHFGPRRAQLSCQSYLALADEALIESGVAPQPMRKLITQLFKKHALAQ